MGKRASEQEHLFPELLSFLEGNNELGLAQQHTVVGAARTDRAAAALASVGLNRKGRVAFYDQANSKVSRKVLEPILQRFFSSLREQQHHNQQSL